MVRVLLALFVATAVSVPAFAQTSVISGVVTDPAGGVIPGAAVVVKHNATGVTTESVSNDQGVFSFPSMQVGTYTVTITLQGFKTFVANNVTISTGNPASLKAILEVGGVTETVQVSSTAEILQTQASSISSTVNMNQIQKLPMTTRSGMDFVNFLPGVSTPGGNRNAVVNGLPRGAINITLDGVNIQDNTNRTNDGFFAIVAPRLDAIEEVTVTTASQGAGDTGQGAVQIKFVTRSGSNDYTGSAYTTARRDAWNANTWFNNRDGVAKAKLQQDQPGARLGGPVSIPGLFDGRNKAFFFVNYEEQRQPSDVTRTRVLFHPLAEQGVYRYTAGGGTQEVNLLALAAANGQTSTIDPTIANLLSAIRAATGTTGTVKDDTNPLTQSYTYNVAVESIRRYPTVRLDYNVTNAHRLTSAFNYQKFTDSPDTLNNFDARFPGFPAEAGQTSVRKSWSNTLRSTLGSLVNELKVAYASSPVMFFTELNKEMYANQGGFNLFFGPGQQAAQQVVTSAAAAPAPQSRNAYNWLVEDSVNWLKGAHSITAGGSWNQYTIWANNSSLLPSITFDVVTGDPALGLFTSANFPGASTTQLNVARNVYAILTGRVNSINGDARLENGQYVYMGTARQEGRMTEAGFFVQDSWRWKPNFTINLGLRYELQFPFTPLNDSYSTVTMDSLCGQSGVNNLDEFQETCNLFQPGTLPGSIPEYVNFGKGVKAFNTDYNNFAPNVGFAWQLGEKNGMLGAILGDEAVIRGGYSKSFSRAGLGDFTGQYATNPGINLFNEPDRNVANGNLGTLPLLFRDTARLTPGTFPAGPVYPFAGTVNDSVNAFYPNIQVPWAESYTIGLQRALGRNHVVEARYVGTRSRDGWTTLNFNEANIIENGFLNEFKAAMNNLRANILAGKGATFAYTGIDGTAPLPIYLAHFQGLNAAAAANPANYTSSNFTNSNFVNPLAYYNPNVFTPASNNANQGLYGTATLRANALAAGLPANFWIANPDKIGGANLTGNGGKTDYNSVQFELRRRLHQGLQFNASYVFGKAFNSTFFSFRVPRKMRRDDGDPGDLTHAFKSTVVYDLPFGRGRRFLGNAGAIMERIAGGWSLSMNSKIQSGRLINLGNRRLVGMTREDVENMFDLRIAADGRVYMLPQDVIDETLKAFNTSATSATGYGSLGAPTGRYFAPANGVDCIEQYDNTYGDCGTGNLIVTGPMFQQHDFGIAKRIALFGSANLELRAEALNVFNQVNYVPVAGVSGANLTNFEVTGLTGTNTSRVLQLIGRINW